MNLLLETHTLLWHAENSPRMSSTATALLVDPSNELFLSMASVWELAIKVGLGKLTLSASYFDFVTKAITGYDVTLINVTLADCVHYEQLSFPNPNHRDPFDRMIITHAQRHSLSVVGSDVAFDSYNVTRLW